MDVSACLNLCSLAYISFCVYIRSICSYYRLSLCTILCSSINSFWLKISYYSCPFWFYQLQNKCTEPVNFLSTCLNKYKYKFQTLVRYLHVSSTDTTPVDGSFFAKRLCLFHCWQNSSFSAEISINLKRTGCGLFYGCTVRTLIKHLEKKLEGNYARICFELLSIYPGNNVLRSLPPMFHVIRERTGLKIHFWGAKDKIINDVLFWGSKCAYVNVGRQQVTNIKQLYEDYKWTVMAIRAINTTKSWWIILLLFPDIFSILFLIYC